MNIAQLGLSSRGFCKSARKKEDPGKGRRSRMAFQGCQYMWSGSGGYSELPWLQTAASPLEQLERGKERDPIQSHHSPPDLCVCPMLSALSPCSFIMDLPSFIVRESVSHLVYER